MLVPRQSTFAVRQVMDVGLQYVPRSSRASAVAD